jgi:C4-dicarboxylate-binding protein DctP
MQTITQPEAGHATRHLRRRAAVRMLSAPPLALALRGAGAAAAQRPILIQFSHVVTPETAKGRAALHFKELAESRTGGRVRVEVYANSTLYKDGEEVDALRLGAVQMLATSLSKLAKWGGGDFDLFDLPFLFKDHTAFRAVVDGPIGSELLRKLEPSGIKGLAYWDNGFKVFTANQPLHGPADFKGLRIRVQASRVLVRQMQALGAVPSVTALISVYEALKDGRLDGQENTPTNIHSQLLHEVQGHMTVSDHGYLAYAVLVNKTFWDKLPGDIRTILEGAMRDATAFANGIALADNTRALERIRRSGRMAVYTPTSQELAQWRSAMMPVYAAASAWISPSMLASVQAAIGALP